jgi:hypothetical protein
MLLELMVKEKIWEVGLGVFGSEQAWMVGSCEQDQQMHFGFINVILLYSGIVQ